MTIRERERAGKRSQDVTGASGSASRLERVSPPLRYGAITLGSTALMLGSMASVPLGPAERAGWREVLALLATAAGLLCLLAASLPTVPALWRRRYARLRTLALACVLPLALGTVFTFAGGAHLALYAPAADSYSTDIIAFTHANAELTLAGHDPYTAGEAVFRATLGCFPHGLATPIRGGVFGTGDDHPAPQRIAQAQRHYVARPASEPGAFDPRTLHSYPALSFLLYVPLLWAGGSNILLLNALVYWALFAWLVWITPEGWRHWGALTALAAMPTMAASLLEGTEVVCIAIVLAAWHARERRWTSAVLLGLACAYKQYVWFFVPFFALETLAARGWHETARRGAIALGAFLLPNLPYIIASPGAWFASLWLPVSPELFPMGMGLITLSVGHLLPYAPPWAYTTLEVGALAAALWAAWRWRARLGDAVLPLALVPLFFAFRSTPNYFAFMPWLALYAANRAYASRTGARSASLATS